MLRTWPRSVSQNRHMQSNRTNSVRLTVQCYVFIGCFVLIIELGTERLSSFPLPSCSERLLRKQAVLL
jgi:hypothetical protein